MKNKIKIENIVILVMGVVIIVLVATLGEINKKILNYEDSYETLSLKYDNIAKENIELTNEVNDLNNNIYNLFEKQPYKLTVHHNNETITYQQSKFGLFDSYIKSTTHLHGSLVEE